MALNARIGVLTLISNGEALEVFQKERNSTEALSTSYGSPLSAGNLSSSGGNSQANKQKNHTVAPYTGPGEPLGCEFEQALGSSEGQGSLPCCCSWGLKEPDVS